MGYIANGRDLRNCLYTLDLAECDVISDDGFIFLNQMVKLTNLNFSKCGVNVTDHGVSNKSQIQDINILDFSWLINVTGISMFDIAKNCWNLSYINLSGC